MVVMTRYCIIIVSKKKKLEKNGCRTGEKQVYVGLMKVLILAEETRPLTLHR